MSISRPTLLILFIIIAILVLCILLRTSCCKLFCHKDGYLTPDTTSYLQQTGLNVLFKDNVNATQKIADIDKIKDSVKAFYIKYNAAYGTTFVPEFFPVSWCPCDSALYTLNYTFVDGEGKSATAPPTQPPPKTGPQGDLVDVLTISQNMPINDHNKSDTATISNDTTVIVNNRNIDNSKILAVMDSGIDSTLFPAYLSSLLWKDPSDKATLYNFLPNQSTKDIFDKSSEKHGSAVTAIAIKAMENSNSYPRIMILKVLDSLDRGTTFSVSCALSYASQNHATMVNASLGYRGIIDSVLLHYIKLCSQNNPAPIELFFAEGNLEGDHNANLCNTDFHDNLLSNPLFYPSCFSSQFSNITSVTQLSQPGYACYYQYFSKDYTTLGVLNTPNSTSGCCKFEVTLKAQPGYQKRYYEGSSFATPYAAGRKMGCIINPVVNGIITTPEIAWQSLIKRAASTPYVTKDGRYIEH
jgi:hypothetical protein